jgi:hypothetical protein
MTKLVLGISGRVEQGEPLAATICNPATGTPLQQRFHACNRGHRALAVGSTALKY